MNCCKLAELAEKEREREVPIYIYKDILRKKWKFAIAVELVINSHDL